VWTDSRQQKHEKQEKAGGILKRVGAGFTSLAGIATAIATITTSAAAVLGVVVHAKTTQLQQAQAQVSSQAQQIQHQALQVHQLQQAAGTTTPSPSTTPTDSGAQLTGVSHYLSNKTPTVNNANSGIGQVVIAAKPYANSISFDCNGDMYGGAPDVAFDVAGSTTFTAEVGIPDDTPDATGFIATITFSNESGQQIGQPIQVSLGHPLSATLNIQGVTQLGMTCVGRNRQTNNAVSDFQVGLGDAGVS
jgi:cell division protein FtsL